MHSPSGPWKWWAASAALVAIGIASLSVRGAGCSGYEGSGIGGTCSSEPIVGWPLAVVIALTCLIGAACCRSGLLHRSRHPTIRSPVTVRVRKAPAVLIPTRNTEPGKRGFMLRSDMLASAQRCRPGSIRW